MPTNPKKVRLILKAGTYEPFTIDKAYIGQKANTYDFNSTPKQVTFNGSNSVVIPTNSKVWTDWIELDSWNASLDLVLSMFRASGNGSADTTSRTSFTGANQYYCSGDDAASQTASGSYTTQSNLMFAVEAVELLEDGKTFSLTPTESVIDNVDRSTYNAAAFQDVLLGPVPEAGSTRDIVVAVAGRQNTHGVTLTSSSLTPDGGSAITGIVDSVQEDLSGTDTEFLAIIRFPNVAIGTTGDFSFTFSSALLRCAISVNSMVDGGAIYDEESIAVATTSPSVDINFYAGGVTLAAAWLTGSGSGGSWSSNIQETHYEKPETTSNGLYVGMTGFTSELSSQTITFTRTDSPIDASLMAVSYAPNLSVSASNSLPDLLMSASLNQVFNLEVNVVPFTVVGNSINLSRQFTLSAQVVSLTTTLRDAAFTKELFFSAEDYSLTQTGYAVDITTQKHFVSDVTTFAVTDNTVNITRDLTFNTVQTSCSLQTYLATIIKGSSFVVDSTQFSVTTEAVTIDIDIADVQPNTTSFVWTPHDVAVTRELNTKTTSTEFSLAANNVNFSRSTLFSVGAVSYVLSGDPLGTAHVSVPTLDLTISGEDLTFAGEVLVDIITIPHKQFSLERNAPTIQVGYNCLCPVLELSMNYGAGFYKVEVIQTTSGSAPASHIKDSKELEGDAYVDLFEITLADKSTRLFFKKDKDGTYQGNTYEGTGIKLDGVAKYADDEVARPKLSLFNPDGVFSSLVDKHLLDSAQITRIRVLKDDFDNDRPVYRRQRWRVSRVATVKKGVIGLELRDMLDGQNFLTPGRMFIPPDFPAVSIS